MAGSYFSTRRDTASTILLPFWAVRYVLVTQTQAIAAALRFVDFKYIQNWAVEDHVEAHASDLKWLSAHVSEMTGSQPRRQIAIFTRYCPVLDTRFVDEKHNSSAVISGFATNLSEEECWKSKSVLLWAFGHTHVSCDFTDALWKRVVADQRDSAAAPEKAFNIEDLPAKEIRRFVVIWQPLSWLRFPVVTGWFGSYRRCQYRYFLWKDA